VQNFLSAKAYSFSRMTLLQTYPLSSYSSPENAADFIPSSMDMAQ
jgi:hypothetical protein